jgi:hypothetical protein
MKKECGYFKKIDFVFYNKKKIQAAIDEIRQDKGHKSYNGSGVSDPTAAVVINNLSPIRYAMIDGRRLEYPERWLKLVDLVYKNASDTGKILLDGLYVYHKKSRDVYESIPIEQPTFSRYWKDIKHIQELYAVQLGLIRVL